MSEDKETLLDGHEPLLEGLSDRDRELTLERLQALSRGDPNSLPYLLALLIRRHAVALQRSEDTLNETFSGFAQWLQVKIETFNDAQTKAIVVLVERVESLSKLTEGLNQAEEVRSKVWENLINSAQRYNQQLLIEMEKLRADMAKSRDKRWWSTLFVMSPFLFGTGLILGHRL